MYIFSGVCMPDMVQPRRRLDSVRRVGDKWVDMGRVWRERLYVGGWLSAIVLEEGGVVRVCGCVRGAEWVGW